MLLQPAYKLTLGSKVVDTTDEPRASTVVDLMVSLDMETPADSFTLIMGQVGRWKPEREDAATIELGYADNGGFVQVMAGKVARVEPDLTTVRIVGHSPAEALLRTFVDRTFEDRKAGEIVRDLAERAEVEVANAEDGTRFPAYVVDGQRSAYHHMRDLADLCGFDFYLNASGRLVFEAFTGGKTVHVLEYARHLVSLEVKRGAARAGQVEAWGESPAGSRGEDAWAWLTHDFSGSRGRAGSGAPTFLLERPVLRTREAARTAAQAAHTAFQNRTLQGRILTIGRPEVKLGDAVRLRNMADDSLNTVFQVRSVTHRINKVGGFTTAVGFRALAA